MPEVRELLSSLIRCPSITPLDAGCQALIQKRLERIGFQCREYSENDVTNLWARLGSKRPLVVFAGHTDVVPPGPRDAWDSDPFVPTEREGRLYGRGATDMKSGLAAMIIATEQFIEAHPAFTGSIAFLITSDEEGPGLYGTRAVIEKLEARNEKIDYCIVGEATSIAKPGDRIRIGRRGSLHGHLTVHGKQGHVAYPELCVNPIHKVAPAIVALASTEWDKGNDSFPPSTFQISNIHAGTGATNMVPGTLELHFNFRFSTAVSVTELQERVTALLNQQDFDYTLRWDCSGLPFLTSKGRLVSAVTETVEEIMHLAPEFSTGGGTSDGRFIAPTGAEVIELGPCAASAHAVNENTCIDHLETLVQLYRRLLEKLL